ncbi:hypothetical protein NKH80_08080 [Mesorhizobium sp. M0904]
MTVEVQALLAGLLRVGADPDIEALERTCQFVAENADGCATRTSPAGALE